MDFFCVITRELHDNYGVKLSWCVILLPYDGWHGMACSFLHRWHRLQWITLPRPPLSQLHCFLDQSLVRDDWLSGWFVPLEGVLHVRLVPLFKFCPGLTSSRFDRYSPALKTTKICSLFFGWAKKNRPAPCWGPADSPLPFGRSRPSQPRPTSSTFSWCIPTAPTPNDVDPYPLPSETVTVTLRSCMTHWSQGLVFRVQGSGFRPFRVYLGWHAQSWRAGWFRQAKILLCLLRALLAETDPARNFTFHNPCLETTWCFLEVYPKQQGMGTCTSPPEQTTVALKLNVLGEWLGVTPRKAYHKKVEPWCKLHQFRKRVVLSLDPAYLPKDRRLWLAHIKAGLYLLEMWKRDYNVMAYLVH